MESEYQSRPTNLAESTFACLIEKDAGDSLGLGSPDSAFLDHWYGVVFASGVEQLLT